MEKIVENEIIKREEKYVSGHFKIEDLTVKLGDKEIKREVFKRPNAAAALVYNTETKKYLFVEQYRAGAEGVMIEIVAGTMEENEKSQDTIKREIAEELGYKVDTMLHISDFYVSPGANTEICALFYVEVSEKIGDGGGVDDEYIRVVEVDDLGMSGNLFFEIPENGDVTPPYKLIDAKSIIAVNAHIQSKMLRDLWKTMSDYKMKSL